MAEPNTEQVGSDSATNGRNSGRNTEPMLSQNGSSKERSERKLTVNVEIEGEHSISVMELMKCVRELCGLVACRFISASKYEMSMSHPRGKERLMDGFKTGDTRVHARELTNDELVVSFLNLPFYVEDY